MGKKLREKISKETHALADAAVDDAAAAPPPPSSTDGPLFVLDTTGNLNSRKSLKRRQRDADDAAASSAALSSLAAATARAKRRDSDRRLRKRPRTATAPPASRPPPSTTGDDLFDVWATAPSPSPSPLTPSLAPRTHRKLAGQFTAHASKGLVPAAQATKAALPDPGQSFHPAADDHEALLTRASNHHLFLFQQNEAVRRQLNPDLFPSSDPTPTPATDAPKAEEEEEEGDGGLGVHRPPTVDRRLTQAQRNRRRAARLKAALHSEAAGTAALHRQLTRLPVILSSLKKAERAQEKRKAVIARLKATQPMHHPRLGPYPQVVEAPPEVALTDELSGSVREVRVSVNVVKDAMRRMEERRLIEVRRKVKGNRRYAMKEFERYKESKEEGILPQYPRKGD